MLKLKEKLMILPTNSTHLKSTFPKVMEDLECRTTKQNIKEMKVRL
jgi:hypothetical protein